METSFVFQWKVVYLLCPVNGTIFNCALTLTAAPLKGCWNTWHSNYSSYCTTLCAATAKKKKSNNDALSHSGLRVDARRSAEKACPVETWALSARWMLQDGHLSSRWSVWASWKGNPCQTRRPKRLRKSRWRRSLQWKPGSPSQVTIK